MKFNNLHFDIALNKKPNFFKGGIFRKASASDVASELALSFFSNLTGRFKSDIEELHRRCQSNPKYLKLLDLIAQIAYSNATDLKKYIARANTAINFMKFTGNPMSQTIRDIGELAQLQVNDNIQAFVNAIKTGGVNPNFEKAVNDTLYIFEKFDARVDIGTFVENYFFGGMYSPFFNLFTKAIIKRYKGKLENRSRDEEVVGPAKASFENVSALESQSSFEATHKDVSACMRALLSLPDPTTYINELLSKIAGQEVDMRELPAAAKAYKDIINAEKVMKRSKMQMSDRDKEVARLAKNQLQYQENLISKNWLFELIFEDLDLQTAGDELPDEKQEQKNVVNHVKKVFREYVSQNLTMFEGRSANPISPTFQKSIKAVREKLQAFKAAHPNFGEKEYDEALTQILPGLNDPSEAFYFLILTAALQVARIYNPPESGSIAQNLTFEKLLTEIFIKDVKKYQLPADPMIQLLKSFMFNDKNQVTDPYKQLYRTADVWLRQVALIHAMNVNKHKIGTEFQGPEVVEAITNEVMKLYPNNNNVTLHQDSNPKGYGTNMWKLSREQIKSIVAHEVDKLNRAVKQYAVDFGIAPENAAHTWRKHGVANYSDFVHLITKKVEQDIQTKESYSRSKTKTSELSLVDALFIQWANSNFK